MATVPEKAQFVTSLAGSADELEKQLQVRKQKADALELLVGSGLDNSRDELREAMTFSVKRRDGKGEVQSMDERGQRKSIETEDARTKYESLDPKVAAQVMRALQKIVKIKDQMVAAEDMSAPPDKDGKRPRLFSTQDIITELFTPLVREGLLPETLVIDGYSEVAIMLREVMASFKGMLKEEDEKRRLQNAKIEADFLKGGTKTERLKGLGGKLTMFVEGQVATLSDKAGMTPEEFNRAKTIATKSLATAKALGKGVTEGLSLDKKLDGVQKTKLSDTVADLSVPDVVVSPVVSKLTEQLSGINAGPLSAVLAEVELALDKAGYKLDELIQTQGTKLIETLTKFAKLIESDGVAIAGDVVSVLSEGISGGTELGGVAGGRYAAGVDIDLAVRRGELRSGILELVSGIEQALQAELLPTSVALAELVSGNFAASVDTAALVDYITPSLGVISNEKPQGATVVARLATALKAALTASHKGLAGTGAALESAFTSAASGEKSRLGDVLDKGEMADPAKVFLPLVGVARTAAKTVFSGTAFKEALTAEGVGDGIEQAAREMNARQQEQELAEADAELETFERELVLIDEGGMEAARQESLDKLIGQLKADQMDLEIVAKVGSLLSGAGGAVTKLGTDARNVAIGQSITEQGLNAAKTVATQVADSLIPALQAAQLVMKMSVTIIKIAKRAELLSKFRADVMKAQKAGSMLLPSIQNFYSAKVTQQVFASIELALQTVQLAGSICASVPEPITMAVGRALTAAAQAAEAGRDLAKTGHDEKSLRKGWKVTLEAMNNPANRRAGLEALRRNATLAVHSIAWAATQGDTMAMEILRSCGVSAQSMADEGSDKDKVIEYLETLLNEDLRFKDTGKVKIKWVPQPLVLSYPGWFTVLQRARGANPPLSQDKTPDLDRELKLLDLQPRLHVLQAHAEDYEVAQLAAFETQARTVAGLLGQMKPVAADRTPHSEMRAVCAQLQGLAENLEAEIRSVKEERAQLQQTVGV